VIVEIAGIASYIYFILKDWANAGSEKSITEQGCFLMYKFKSL